MSGLYLEGARWDVEKCCLTKSHPKVLIEELPILRVIPIEAHRLKLVVSYVCNLHAEPHMCREFLAHKWIVFSLLSCQGVV